jgi:endo-1,4-beta-xylanase
LEHHGAINLFEVGKMKSFAAIFWVLMMVMACEKNPEKLIDCQETRLYENADFLVGVAVSNSRIETDPLYLEKVTSQFNSLTPEYAFKPANIHLAPNHFNFYEADKLVDFAMKNNQQIHAHTLIWHEDFPQWMWGFQGDYRELMKLHIQTIMTRYKGKIRCWDVVNEAFNDDGNLRPSPWLEKIGDEYVALAFQFAREADPEALLFFNENFLETKPQKQQAVINMINNFRASGIPIDGIGLQFHIAYNYPTEKQIKNALKLFAGTGLKIHLSELDIALNINGTEKKPSYRLLKEQKRKMEFIVTEYRKLSAQNKYAITLWGVSDQHSWIKSFFERDDWPLLYDDNYRIKPAYCGFKEGLR